MQNSDKIQWRQECGAREMPNYCSWEFQFLSNIRSYAHKVSPTWQLKCELNKDDTHEYAELNGEKPMVPQSHPKKHSVTKDSWE